MEPLALLDRAVASVAVEQIVAVAENDVGAVVAVELVDALAALQHVVVMAAEDYVFAGAT